MNENVENLVLEHLRHIRGRVDQIAEDLKKAGKIEIPKYVDLIKLAHFKELAPMDNDWYYYRCGMPQWVLHVVSARVSVL